MVGSYLAPEKYKVVLLSSSDHDKIQAETERQLNSIPIFKELVSAAEQWKYERPYDKMDEASKQGHITASTLAQPGMLTIQPCYFINKARNEAICIVHIGRNLSDKGFLTLISDHAMARVAAENTPSGKVVTANLDVKYYENGIGFLIIRAVLERIQGRKVYVHGSIQMMDGRRLVDAKALFLEPKVTTLT